MNGDVGPLLAAARRALREVVLPNLHCDDARSQLAAVVDVLAKLEPMTGWATALDAEERAALAAGLEAIEARARAADLAMPEPAGGDLAALQERARAMSDFLFDTVPAGALRDELDALLRRALRDALAAERRHIPPTDFGAMTGSPQG